MRTNPTAPLLRAFREAPWRTQTQAVAVVSILLLVVAIIGGFYLTVASRAATAGRDLQQLELQKTALLQANSELLAQLAELRSVDRLAARAQTLGFVPANPEQIDYLKVAEYPYMAQTSAPPRAAAPAQPKPSTLAQVVDWLAQVLQGLVLGGSGQGG
ncbi:MAG: hypothetical protein IT317_22325 [Anaerolineales bacterium]|nr:hypothetical protein [Anaerolineales bacterium]